MEAEKLLFTVVTLVLVCTEIHHVTCDRFYILSSSSSISCPGQLTGESCLTLQQFADNGARSGNVSLIMEAGVHVLDSQRPLSLSNIDSFSMVPMVAGSDVRITCSDIQESLLQSTRFRLSSVSYVQIQGVSFEECRDRNDSSTNTGMEMSNITNSIEFDNVSFTHFDTVRIEGVADSSYSTQIRMRNISFSFGSRLDVGPGGEFSIVDSHFMRNSQSALALSGFTSATVTRCRFNSNVFNSQSERDQLGGALYVFNVRTLLVNKSIFDKNWAGTGGAIYSLRTHIINVLRSTFDGNWAGTEGGAIFAASDGTISTNWSNFTNNRANENGGALYVEVDSTSISVNNGYFKNNTVGTGSGGVIFDKGQATSISLADSTFEHNSAPSCGVLDVSDVNRQHHVTILTSTFSHNRATDQSIGGGVICARSTFASIFNSTFSHNSAASHAGVMYIDDGNLDVARSLFINNSADVNGGVMYSNINRTIYTVRLSSFDDNTAGDSGGVIFVGRSNSLVSLVSVERSSFGYNSAGNRGGVIAIIGSELMISESNVFNNSAPLGGVVSACNSVVKVPSELTGAQDPNDPVCMFYDGFIQQELGITTSMPVTMTTSTANPTTISGTTQSEPSTANPTTISGTTQSEPSTANPTTISGTTQSEPSTAKPTTISGTTQSEPSTIYTTDSMILDSTSDINREITTSSYRSSTEYVGSQGPASQSDRNGSHCSNFPSVYIIVPLVMVLLLLQLVCVF